jgi:hypothetical protein
MVYRAFRVRFSFRGPEFVSASQQVLEGNLGDHAGLPVLQPALL